MELFSVFARIKLNKDGFDKGIDQAKGKGDGLGRSFGAVGAKIGVAAAAIKTNYAKHLENFITRLKRLFLFT